MNIGFLGATKDVNDEKFEQAVAAMRAADTPKKVIILKLIEKCRPEQRENSKHLEI